MKQREYRHKVLEDKMATEQKQQQKNLQKLNIEKKMNKSFVTYLHKILKNNGNCHIGLATVQQLNLTLHVLTMQLATESRNLCIHDKRCTVGVKDIRTAVNIWFPPNMADDIQVTIVNSLDKYKKHKEEHTKEKGEKRAKPVRVETQAGLYISSSLVEGILRYYGLLNLSVAKLAIIALTAVIEYVTTEILSETSSIVREAKKKTIYTRHLYLAMRTNPNLDFIRQKLHLELLGGGVVPGYNPALDKKQETTKIVGIKDNNKCPPGDKSLEKIKELQQTTELLLQKDPFEKEVRAIAEHIMNNTKSLGMLKKKITDKAAEGKKEKKPVVRFRRGTILALEYFVEQQVTNLLAKAVNVGVYAKHEGVKGTDVEIVWDLVFPQITRCVDNKGNAFMLTNVSKNGIERLAYRGGVKRKRAEMFTVVREFMYSLISTVLHFALHYIEHRDGVTVCISDLIRSVSNLGINFTVPEIMEKPKKPKKTKSASAPSSPRKTQKKTEKPKQTKTPKKKGTLEKRRRRPVVEVS